MAVRAEAERFLAQEARVGRLTLHRDTLVCQGCSRMAFRIAATGWEDVEWGVMHRPECELVSELDPSRDVRQRQVRQVLDNEAVETAWRDQLAWLDTMAYRGQR